MGSRRFSVYGLATALIIIALLSLLFVSVQPTGAVSGTFPTYAVISKPPIDWLAPYAINIATAQSPVTSNIGVQTTVTGTATYAVNGSPVKLATVAITQKVSGVYVPLTTTTTGNDGKFTFRFTPEELKAYEFKAVVSKGDFSGTEVITITPGNRLPVAAFTANPDSGNATLSVMFDASSSTDQDNNIDPNGYEWDFGDTKMGFGKKTTHDFTVPGCYTVKLTVTDLAGGKSTATKKITVLDGTVIATPTPASADAGVTLLLIAGAAVLGLIVLAVALFLLFSWLKSTLKVLPKQKTLPCDGKSQMPVRVQFVNGFGMAKKMKSDVDVEMESTAGTIQGVTIPAGKEYAEAKLTSSTECGPVTVTAKAKGKSGEAQVSFTYKKATVETQASPAEIMADGKSSSTITAKFKDENNVYFSFIGDKTVQFNTNLGTITSPVKLPAKAPSATATLTSGDISGVAAILVTLDDLRGETKVSFKGVPKKYCMHCGEPNSLEEEQCHKCGLTPPSGMDTKRCAVAECGTVLPDTAKYCYKCGARQPDKK